MFQKKEEEVNKKKVTKKINIKEEYYHKKMKVLDIFINEEENKDKNNKDVAVEIENLKNDVHEIKNSINDILNYLKKSKI